MFKFLSKRYAELENYSVLQITQTIYLILFCFDLNHNNLIKEDMFNLDCEQN